MSRLLCGVRSESVSRIVIGGIAAAATAGALVAIGHRIGRAALPFAELGALIVRHAPSRGAPIVLAGIGVHVLITFAWTLVFVWLADRLNRVVLAAIMVGAANFLVSWIIARSTGHGLASVVSLGDRLTLALILAAALAAGMRYARPSSRNATTD